SIARRLVRFGSIAKVNLEHSQKTMPPIEELMFDEMESFEHTKCKPLTIPIAVETKTRRVICLKVARIPAKGKLAEISRKKYGPRPCKRRRALAWSFLRVARCSTPEIKISTDESRHYPA